MLGLYLYTLIIGHKSCNNYVKDARSVSLYPYNRSQIVQYVNSILVYKIKKTLKKKLPNFVTNNVLFVVVSVFFFKKRTQQQQDKVGIAQLVYFFTL